MIAHSASPMSVWLSRGGRLCCKPVIEVHMSIPGFQDQGLSNLLESYYSRSLNSFRKGLSMSFETDSWATRLSIRTAL